VAKAALAPEVLALVAGRFKALSEPARLRILQCLRSGELSVGELVNETELGQANLSRHLQMLHAHGFVVRRKKGLFVYYALADKSVLKLCDIMCGRLEMEIKTRGRLLAS
jgi:DNA-binding transcriptional ArsR family regulator